ncbi:MAG: hypothetical protein K2N05_00470 [Muribaculaceae bacterium]|nr:hypothetical protein [Muribaculaceae bacterium]
METNENNEKKWDLDIDSETLWGWIMTIVVILVLWWLCPSKQKMEAEVSRSIIEEQLYKFAQVTQLDQYLDVDTDHLSDEEVIRKVEKEGTIEVKNLWLVKLAYFKKNGKKKDHFVGIGLCGFVLTKGWLIQLIR